MLSQAQLPKAENSSWHAVAWLRVTTKLDVIDQNYMVKHESDRPKRFLTTFKVRMYLFERRVKVLVDDGAVEPVAVPELHPLPRADHCSELLILERENNVHRSV